MQMPSSISTRLQYQHKSLIDIIEGLSDEQIRLAMVPGKWSIFENIVHLQTYQHAMINRIKRILEEDEPVFDRYTAEADPLFHDNLTKSSREIIHDLLTTRKEMSAGILSFKETDLDRKGSHPLYGKMTVVQWLNFFLLHEAHHLFTILKLTPGLRQVSGQ
ncbi:MAG: DinB family protein [Chitinophagaceae bacterium]|nr:DinB family protein [Chitinophagaceae bacterium]